MSSVQYYLKSKIGNLQKSDYSIRPKNVKNVFHTVWTFEKYWPFFGEND